jgi:hypothetical protein
MSFFRIHELSDYVFGAVQGDDLFVGFEVQAINAKFGSPARMAEAFTAYGKSLGLVVKVGTSLDITDGEFLSSRFYPVAEGYALGRKPGRTLVKIGFLLYKAGRKPLELFRLMLGNLKSLLPTSAHVPFLRRYIAIVTDALFEKFADLKALYAEDWLFRLKGRTFDVCADTWAYFENLYGVGLSEENWFSINLKAHIKKYGITSHFICDYVNRLFETDLCEGPLHQAGEVHPQSSVSPE